ncbi:hypothetical protein I4F81_010385 [Pyropia yezoensis]|uniref:Uncharacterized protein n=1 Tax=Pyropia yezoensis TaxID=2788 RepID=A0ACC3CDK1_PYRYE|nr:hypothetical protein I4F81_010385 [Neopyropia yezoensis]|eukprot:contig_7360_g1727
MKLSMPPNPIQRRATDNKLMVFGLTGFEWVTTTGALVILYLCLGGFFVGMLAISKKIRNDGDTYPRPGTNSPFEDE